MWKMCWGMWRSRRGRAYRDRLAYDCGMGNSSGILRLGARGSLLSRRQSELVARALEAAHPGLRVELVIVSTSGDRIQDKPLYAFGGKGLFTKELDEALLRGEVDFAVHSFKDVPVTMPLVDQADLIIAAVPQREDPRDVLASGKARSISDLPQGAKVGTGSLRRKCQILALRPDLNVELIRGNIDTRVRKLHEGQYDAVILALAGLKRSGLYNDTDMNAIPAEQMLPAAAQGALAIQCRKNDQRTREILEAIDDAKSHQCVDLERAVVLALNGDCHSPIAALATLEGNQIHLRAAVGARGGELPVIRAEAAASASDANIALDAVMQSLEKQNVRQLLAGASR